jgi:hypothetical protein
MSYRVTDLSICSSWKISSSPHVLETDISSARKHRQAHRESVAGQRMCVTELLGSAVCLSVCVCLCESVCVCGPLTEAVAVRA